MTLSAAVDRPPALHLCYCPCHDACHTRLPCTPGRPMQRSRWRPGRRPQRSTPATSSSRSGQTTCWRMPWCCSACWWLPRALSGAQGCPSQHQLLYTVCHERAGSLARSCCVACKGGCSGLGCPVNAMTGACMATCFRVLFESVDLNTLVRATLMIMIKVGAVAALGGAGGGGRWRLRLPRAPHAVRAVRLRLECHPLHRRWPGPGADAHTLGASGPPTETQDVVQPVSSSVWRDVGLLRYVHMQVQCCLQMCGVARGQAHGCNTGF